MGNNEIPWTLNFSSDAMDNRRENKNIFKALREKNNILIQNLIPNKKCFKNEDKIKIFSDVRIKREWISRALQYMKS